MELSFASPESKGKGLNGSGDQESYVEEKEIKDAFNCKPFDQQWHGSDILLKVEDVVFHVHSIILTMASPVFKAMLNNNFKEGNEKVISLPDKQKEHVLELLKLVYPVPHRLSDESDCKELLSLAREYNIKKVFDLVDDYFNHVLQENLHKDKVLFNFELTEKFGLERSFHRHLDYYSSKKRCKRFVGHWRNIEWKTKVNVLLNRCNEDSVTEAMKDDLYKSFFPTAHESFDFSEPWENSDVVIQCSDGNKLHAHSNVLLIASETFEEIFDRRSYDGVVNFSDYDKMAVVALLHIIYPIGFTLNESKPLNQLLELARKFCITRVFSLVDDFLSLYVVFIDGVEKSRFGLIHVYPTVKTHFFVYTEKYDLERGYNKLFKQLQNASSKTLENSIPWEKISCKTKLLLMKPHINRDSPFYLKTF